MRNTLIAMTALLVAGCGGEAKKGFDDSFNNQFHEAFISSCVKSATGGGVEQALASKLCTCASDKVKERYSVKEKMGLKNEQLTPIIEECKASVGG